MMETRPEETTAAQSSTQPAEAPSQTVKSDLRRDIEAALVGDPLREFFATLDPAAKERFRVAAEAVASEFEAKLASGASLDARATRDHIAQMLKVLPPTDWAWREQALKISTDDILGRAASVR